MWNKKKTLIAWFAIRKQMIKKIRGLALANKIATQRSLCALFVLQENQLFINKNIKFIGNVKRNADFVL